MRLVIGQSLLVLMVSTLALAQSTPAAQETRKLEVGDPAVDGTFLKPYKNAWKVVYAFPGKEPFLVGMWTDELKDETVGGRKLLKRMQTADYAKYGLMTTYVNVFDPKTMAPVMQEFKRSDTGEFAHREFERATVKYNRKSTEQAAPDIGELKLQTPIFDYNGGMFGVLLAALPLQEGLKGTLPTLSEDRDELEWVTFSVGKQELVEAGPGKQVMAWPVDTVANYANQSHSIFWVTKEAPYVIKLVTIIPGGKWVTVTLSMI